MAGKGAVFEEEDGMTPLEPVQREGIMRRLAFIDQEMGDLAAYDDLDRARYETDRAARRNVERMAENVVNAAIDVAKILGAGENLELPATYREAFLQLARAGLISEELGNELAHLARARNVLAHHYLDMKWDLIHRFLGDGRSAVADFVTAIRAYLDTAEKHSVGDGNSGK